MFATSVHRIAVFLLGAVTVVLAGVLLVPRAFGLEPYVVTSGSMRPTFDPGAVVLVEDVLAASLEVGDVVTYRTPEGTTTHRIVGRHASGGGAPLTFETRGDANNAADTEPLDGRNVQGRMQFAVPKAGYLVNAVRSPVGLAALTGLLLVAWASGGRARRPAPSTRIEDRPAVPTGASS